MKRLKGITLVIVDTVNHMGAIQSMMKSLSQIKPDKAALLTDIKITSSAFDVVKIRKIKSKKDYSKFIIKELYKYFDTDYVLIAQHDSWVLDYTAWDDRFLKYDVIGACWQYSDGRNGFNGGFTLRSRKLQKILATDPKIEITSPEDEIIGRLYRHYLEENHGIKFAPYKLADKFSFELNEPVSKTFGFHSFFHHPYREAVVISRQGAMGDLILAEPVIDYFSNKGYRVYIDTPPELFQVFAHYNHLLKHISQLKQGTKAKIYDLDMTYERYPKQLVLKSYYEACGIEDGELRNSRLYLHHAEDQKLFERYVVIHNDDTGISHRNINGLNWFKVVEFLKEQGYLVIQTGKRTSKKIPGAIQFNASTKHLLMFLIKGAEMFIGLDSGVAQIAVAFNIPSVIFFGSVNPEYRYVNFERIRIVHSECSLNKDYYCYHEIIDGVTGKDCEVDVALPPCAKFLPEQVIEKIKELL